MESQGKQCQEFVDACIQKRVSPEKFRVIFTTFHDKHPTLRMRIFLHVLLTRPKNGSDDPRIPLYVKEALRMRVVSVADVLSSLLPPPLVQPTEGQSVFYDQTMLEIGGTQKPSLQALIFHMLLVELSDGLLKTKSEVKAVLKILMPWMSLLPGSTTLGYLLSAILGMTITQEILGQTSTEGSQHPSIEGSKALILLAKA